MKQAKGLVVTLGTVAALLASAAPATAVKPARGCGTDFNLITQEDLAQELREDFPDATEEQLQAFLDSIDKNEDDLFCEKSTPSRFGGNVVDNTSNS